MGINGYLSLASKNKVTCHLLIKALSTLEVFLIIHPKTLQHEGANVNLAPANLAWMIARAWEKTLVRWQWLQRKSLSAINPCSLNYLTTKEFAIGKRENYAIKRKWRKSHAVFSLGDIHNRYEMHSEPGVAMRGVLRLFKIHVKLHLNRWPQCHRMTARESNKQEKPPPSSLFS